jgi:hypothetical protein
MLPLERKSVEPMALEHAVWIIDDTGIPRKGTRSVAHVAQPGPLSLAARRHTRLGARQVVRDHRVDRHPLKPRIVLREDHCRPRRPAQHDLPVALHVLAPAASFATDSSANLASDDDQAFDEPAMPHRFLPLTALICVLVSLTAHAQAQEAAPGGARGRILDSAPGRAVPTATVHLMRNQGIQVTVEADTAGESWFDHVPEDGYSVEVEGQSCLKAIRADERIVLRRAAAVEFALVCASGTTGASNLTSRGLRLRGPEFMIAESS